MVAINYRVSAVDAEQLVAELEKNRWLTSDRGN